ncbi:MAG: class I SAM-dependent methyltransferase [Pirellulales bacterium]
MKPLGYAGDHTMQADFWARSEFGEGLARAFDRYFQKQQAVEAVRGRMRLTADAIVERCTSSPSQEFRVASIVSGPGIDLALAAEALPPEQRRRLRLTLIDIDEGALAAARERLLPQLPEESIRTCRENVARLAHGRRGSELLHESDFVVCPGLFDYLADAEAAAMLRLFAAALRPGGIFYVGNFAPHCTSRAYMEWIGNWYLIYRTAEELQALSQAADLEPAATRITSEPTGRLISRL